MTKPCRLVAKRGLNAQKTGRYFAVQLIGYSGQNPPPEPPDPHLNKKDDPAYIIEWTDSTDNRSSGYDGFEWWGDVKYLILGWVGLLLELILSVYSSNVLKMMNLHLEKDMIGVILVLQLSQ